MSPSLSPIALLASISASVFVSPETIFTVKSEAHVLYIAVFHFNTT